MQRPDEEKSKDAQGWDSGDAENVSTGGKASTGGDGVVSAGDNGCEVGNAVGVALSQGGTGG